MTAWQNVGVFGPNDDSILRELLEKFENSMNEGVVDTNPPTLRLVSCDERKRKERARTFLHDLDSTVETVVFLSNSNTADWGTGYIYSEPDDLREIELVEKISGKSGMQANDVEQALRERGFAVSKRHYTNRIEKEDMMELFVEE